MHKNILLLFASLLFCFLFSEFTVFLVSELSYLPLRRPSYDFKSIDFVGGFWGDINPHFGVWHKSHHQYRHIFPCFDVVYSSNSYGARDIERRLVSGSTDRVIVLGDSFIEGYGVQYDKRLTSILEDRTTKEHLNFGTSGDFGTIQYWLQYKHLAKKYQHNSILISIFPGNDFTDNNIEHGRKIHSDRYRPYLVGDYPDYELIYYVDDLTKSIGHPSNQSYAKGFFREFTFSYNLLGYLKILLRTKENNSTLIPDKSDRPNSALYEFSDQDFLKMKFTLEQIINEARNKKIIVFTIPTLGDIKRFDVDGVPPLNKKLKRFLEDNNVLYIDILSHLHSYTKDWEKYYHSCDGHWSEFGNLIIAQYLIENLPIYKGQ